MKFVYSEWNELFTWNGTYLPTIVIENQKTFREFLCELYAALDGFPSKCVLSENNKILDMTKNIEIISEFVHFDINKKTLLSKIISSMENAALNSTQYLKTQELLSVLENAVADWSFDFSCDIIPTKLSVPAILKSIGIELKNDYTGHSGELEKILDYMELVREFDRDKIFFFINMRAYFLDAATESFMQTCIAHEHKILMIESKAYPILQNEKRITIDMDLCEF
ncbi:MAG: type II-A CRISPR-associated protein Csn2 [Clostridiales bacterium]|nr:type II-A CRISPR-associated protein Csn2 [Clostridiales bacterium]